MRLRRTLKMHEFSICRGLVDAVLSEITGLDGNPKLVTAGIAVGKLHQVVPDTLTFAYETMTSDTIAAGSRLEIRFVDITARCCNCGWEGPIADSFFLCAECASTKVETITGKELFLERLEIEDQG